MPRQSLRANPHLMLDITPLNKAFIGIGSNLGNPPLQCRIAIDSIQALSKTRVIKESTFYETSPLIPENRSEKNIPLYTNAVCKIETQLSPTDLMASLLNIEEKMGRVRRKKWESRIIDLDLLFYDQVVLSKNSLVVPHPEICHRRFVLEPLNEIEPQLFHPVLNKTINQLFSQLLNTELDRLNAASNGELYLASTASVRGEAPSDPAGGGGRRETPINENNEILEKKKAC